MELDVEKLIVLVEERPTIYNYTLKDHHNKDVLDNIWDEVAKEINLSGAECKAKWNILRTSYARYLRDRNKISNSSGGLKKKKWYLADRMSFLQPYIRPHKKQESVDNLTAVQAVEDSGSNQWEQQLNEDDNSSSTVNASSEESPPHPCTSGTNSSAKRRRTSSVDLIAGPMIEYLKSKSSQPRKKEHTNINLQFFETLIPDIEKLSARRQRHFKEKVLSILNVLLDEEESETSIKP